MSGVLRFDNFTLSFGDNPPVVRDLSFDVGEGETIALVGESGSGKSVSALSVLRLLDERLVRYPRGSILYRGEDLLQARDRRLRQIRGRSISMIFQEPMTSLNPLHTVEKQISETLALHKGLRGEKARALVLQPDVLVLDEPTSALDRTVQKQVIELLQQLQARYRLSYLFISHDLAVVRALSHQLLVLRGGKVVERGPADDIFQAPATDYTRELLTAALFYRSPEPEPAAGVRPKDR